MYNSAKFTFMYEQPNPESLLRREVCWANIRLTEDVEDCVPALEDVAIAEGATDREGHNVAQREPCKKLNTNLT